MSRFIAKIMIQRSKSTPWKLEVISDRYGTELNINFNQIKRVFFEVKRVLDQPTYLIITDPSYAV
jgi:hypothetical protein